MGAFIVFCVFIATFADMKIGVFCSANERIDPDFFEMTKELGEWIASEDHTLVFGGTDMGLMECIAKTVHKDGAQVYGVVPTMVEQRGRVSDYNDVEIRCENLSDRKDLMLMHSDVLIALPGGIGTLDEIFTIAASHTIGYHRKKIVLYNMKGFWDKLIALLEDLQEKGFIRGNYQDYIAVANNLEELKKIVSEDL